jgi:hypothetical protein
MTMASLVGTLTERGAQPYETLKIGPAEMRWTQRKFDSISD